MRGAGYDDLSDLACAGLSALSAEPRKVVDLVVCLGERGLLTSVQSLSPAMAALARRGLAKATSGTKRRSAIGLKFDRVVFYELTADGEDVLDHLHESGWSILRIPSQCAATPGHSPVRQPGTRDGSLIGQDAVSEGA